LSLSLPEGNGEIAQAHTDKGHFRVWILGAVEMTVRRTMFVPCAVMIAICACGLVSGLQNKTESPTIVAVEGGAIFRNHCAVCHGRDGRGHGPAIVALKDAVPWLEE
jgi:cytochrome c553